MSLFLRPLTLAAMVLILALLAAETALATGPPEADSPVIIHTPPSPESTPAPVDADSEGLGPVTRLPQPAPAGWTVSDSGRFEIAPVPEAVDVGDENVVGEAPPLERHGVDSILAVSAADLDTPDRSVALSADRNGERSAAHPAAQAATSAKQPVATSAAQDEAKTAKASKTKGSKAKAKASKAKSAKTGKAETAREKAANASQRRKARIDRASAKVKRSERSARARRRQPAVKAPKIRAVPVATVQGITVHRRIAGKTRALLAAADRADLRLGGWGYRSTQRQIQLRRKHCGKSRYATFRMPSGGCWPPTAQPGKSMHERGLAIDFHVKGRKGRTLPIAGTKEFRWLKRNAARFGFYNLPSEPWHWSTNGR